MIASVYLWGIGAMIAAAVIFYALFEFKKMRWLMVFMSFIIFYGSYILFGYHPAEEIRFGVETLLATPEGTALLIHRIEETKKDPLKAKEADRLIFILQRHLEVMIKK